MTKIEPKNYPAGDKTWPKCTHQKSPKFIQKMLKMVVKKNQFMTKNIGNIRHKTSQSVPKATPK